MSQISETLFYIAAMVLLPIVPAYVLFKTLPSTGRAEGPFKGLKINCRAPFVGTSFSSCS